MRRPSAKPVSTEITENRYFLCDLLFGCRLGRRAKPPSLRLATQLTLSALILVNGSAQDFANDHLDLTLWPSRREVRIALPDQTLLLYGFATNQSRPSVLELYTFQGADILLSNPEQHRWPTGLGYDLTLDRLAFSGTTTNLGRQVAEATLSRTVRTRDLRSAESEISQTIYWLRPGYNPSGPLADQALLVEQRTLTLSLNRAQQLTTVQWDSQFSAHPGNAPVRITTRLEQGLGLALFAPTNAIIEFINTPPLSVPDDTPASEEQDPWIGIRVAHESGNYTAALFPHPDNSGDPVAYYASQPSPFLSVSQDFGPQPFELEAGKSFEVRYLILLYSANTSADIIGKQYRRWVAPNPYP